MNLREIDISLVLPPLSYEDLERENPRLVPRKSDDNLDTEAWENLIHSMPQKYLEILVCFYLGFKHKEVQEILGYKSWESFIQVNHDMRLHYKRNKSQFLGYN